MKRIGIICLAVLASIAIHAQTVTNVVAKQVGNTVEITYDLDKPAKVALKTNLKPRPSSPPRQ